MPTEVDVSAVTPDRFRSLLPPDRFEGFERGVREARELLDGRVVWNVKSTARDGGVVELLHPLVAYARGAGVDVRWLVIDGTPEGFCLTVAEAMWKARPVVASRIGGIQEQIVDGDSGVLLDDPRDLAAFGAAVTNLLADPQWAERRGRRARERVREEFLSVRSLLDYLALIPRVLAAPSPAMLAGA